MFTDTVHILLFQRISLLVKTKSNARM